MPGYGRDGYGLTEYGSPSGAHAAWALQHDYADQLDYDYVGPHDIAVEWEGYNPRPERRDADVVAYSLSGLWDRLENASSGDVVWLDRDAGPYLIDGNGYRERIPAGVTLASDGARIYSDSGQNGVFLLTNDGARLTGIHFEGHQATGTVEDYQQYVGVLVRGDVEIDNCVFEKWSLAGIYVGFPSNDTQVVQPHIHHNVIIDNRWDGYGYGIVTYDGADPLLEYNFLNNNRHGIAASGNPNSSYRAYNNLHGTEGMIHQIEQHGPGGDRMDVANNELRMTQKNGGGTDVRAYSQRGTPNTGATIDNNWIHNPVEPGSQPDTGSDAAIVQYQHGSTEWVNVTFSGNHYGSTEPADSSVGIQELTNVGDTTAPTYTLEIMIENELGSPVQGITAEITRIGDVGGSAETLTVADGETHVIASGESETYTTTTVEPGGELIQERGSELNTTGE